MYNHTAMDIYAVLGDPTRRGLLDALADGPKPAHELVDSFKLSQPGISKHLRVLREAGLVESHAVAGDGRVRLYSVRPAPLRELQRWLGRFWQGQLDAFAEYARQQS